MNHSLSDAVLDKRTGRVSCLLYGFQLVTCGTTWMYICTLSISMCSCMVCTLNAPHRCESLISPVKTTAGDSHTRCEISRQAVSLPRCPPHHPGEMFPTLWQPCGHRRQGVRSHSGGGGGGGEGAVWEGGVAGSAVLASSLADRPPHNTPA